MRVSTSAKISSRRENGEFGLRAPLATARTWRPSSASRVRIKSDSPSFVLRSTIACREYVGPTILPHSSNLASFAKSASPEAFAAETHVLTQSPPKKRASDRSLRRNDHFTSCAIDKVQWAANKTAEPFDSAVRPRPLCDCPRTRRCNRSDTQAMRACESPR